jgi:tRNA threonylcarbamoyladenosine biosynthesis protein TsaE
LPIVHVDVYRLGSLNEFDDLDVFEMALGGVLVIEWGDAVDSALPDDHLRVEFIVEEDETRILRLIPSGDWVSRDLAGVA